MRPAHRRASRPARHRLAVLAVVVICLAGSAGGWLISRAGSRDGTSTGATLAASGPWRTAWALSLGHPGDLDGSDLTCRFVARVGESGGAVRFRLVNYPATGPVTFARIMVGLRTQQLAVDPATLRPVTVGGEAGVTLASGASVLTDPVTLPVKAGDDLAVSIAVSSGTSAPWHYWTPQVGACTPPGGGDRTGDASGGAFDKRNEDRWLDQVQVLTSTPVPTVAVYGDSLSDGIYLPFDTGARWTDHLQTDTSGRVVVLNYGVAGDLLTGHAPAGQEPPRLRTDVLAPADLSAVVVQMGSNDIKAGVSAKEILDAFAVVARSVEASKATLVVATVPPRSDGLSAAAERQRRLLNDGLRRYPIVADLDRALSDPGAPTASKSPAQRASGAAGRKPATARLQPRYDIGDHIHPNVAGVAVITATMREALARVPGPLGAAVR